MLTNIFDKILKEEEEEEGTGRTLSERAIKEIRKEAEVIKKKLPEKKSFSLAEILPGILILLLALGIRWFFLFHIEDPQNSHPGWYEDVYHHWQIAYLSLKIGFHQSFLRLWDLKGMEYFWGLLHPLVLATIMKITGSSSIIQARLLSLFCGGLNIFLVYLLVKRYFGRSAGAAAALVATFNPVGIYSDVSGMQEPLGILLLLTGLYFWPKKGALTGIFWMLAGMVRAEYWLLGLGLMGATIFAKQKFEAKIFVWIGYVSLMLVYMKYLLDKTGNAIYPMYWNFLGNMKGDWQAKILPNPQQLLVQKIYIAILIVSLIYMIYLIWKKPPYSVFFFLGIGNWLILALTIGLSKYLLSYLTRFWVDRIMILPYLFVAVWLSVLIFKILGKKWLSILAWLLVIVAIAATQLLWQPIWFWRSQTAKEWNTKTALAAEVAQYYTQGKILFFEDHPASTYWLVYKYKIPGDQIIGQMFDPYYYMEGDPYLNWGENREIVLKWLKKENIQLMAFLSNRTRYLELIKREPEYFEKLSFDPQYNLYIYKVKI